MKCLLRPGLIYSIAILAVLGLADCCQAQTLAQRVASGLSNPLYGTFAPGDTDRMFLLEQGSGGTARIKILDLTSNSVSGTPFLTISGISTGGERGLLGLAFDPDYGNNGYFYIYGSFSGGADHQSRVRRYTAQGDPATSNTANAGSGFEIMSFSQPFPNHNGGWIGFDPTSSDPYLYVATGDGGSSNDPQNNAQDITNNLLGKMLRIDVSGDDFPGSATANYAIPPGNPFVGTTGDDEIWAYGLRNPWRNSFDRATGDLWIGDVGQNAREEVDVQPAGGPGGENFGWRVKEGKDCFDDSQAGGNPPCAFGGFADPIYTYGHSGGSFGGFSVTGGYVYRGSIAQYEGLYFFADFSTNNIWTIDPLANDPQASVIRRNAELPTSAGSYSGISSFAEDADGELYVFSFSGDVFRIESTARDAVWNGDDGTIGVAGDGTNWSDANNWTRDGIVDQLATGKDRVIFSAGSSNPNVSVQSARIVGGLEFQADYILSGASLTVLSGNTRVNSGVTATINSDLAAETTAASLRKWGAGRLNANGSVGQTVVLEGTFGGTGTVDSIRVLAGAVVAPGSSIGTLSTDSYEMSAGSTLEIEVATSSADLLDVSGTATIRGALSVFADSYDQSVRGTVDTFQIVTAGSLEGLFDEVTYDGTIVDQTTLNNHVGDGLFTGLIIDTTDVTLVNYYALSGDANGDRVVDFLDFNIWAANRFQSGMTWTEGDFDGNGTTDLLDFNIWSANRFTSVENRAPEPSSMLAWLLGLTMLLPSRSQFASEIA